MGDEGARSVRKRKTAGKAVWFVGALGVVLAGAGMASATRAAAGSKTERGDRQSASASAGPSSAAPRSQHPGPSEVDAHGPPGAPDAGGLGIVAASAKEVDLAKDISYAPDRDPSCKSPAPITSFAKDLGYSFDQALRSAESVTDEEEMEIGREAFREVRRAREMRGKIDTPEMASSLAYIREVAKPLLDQVARKGISYTFHTVDDDEPNAFAIPGGHVFVNRGMLEAKDRVQNEAQLAGVLAHEINHVDRRHTIAVFEYLKQIGSPFGGGIEEVAIDMARHPFTSKQEEEADRYAVRFLIHAQYSPKQFVSMWQAWARLEKEKPERDVLGSVLDEVLRTHPLSSLRACQAMKITMTELDPSVDRYYVGATNYAQKTPRATKQF